MTEKGADPLQVEPRGDPMRGRRAGKMASEVEELRRLVIASPLS